ncbi:MAG: hypothetical protein HY659_04295 [Rhizobiales bacterium]|nr:hypothetical protein [Hyphomicrobiales bacterium]
MSDYRDPNRLPEIDELQRNKAELGNYSPIWGWVMGAAFLAIVVLIAFSTARNGTQSTQDTMSKPPITTGQTNRPAFPPAANRPATPPATTGQGSPQ